MGLFQHSVLNKYLNEADQTEMKAAYQKLTDYFHNPVIQQNIRDCKEEEYQGEFLAALFVDILNYTAKPSPAFNLTREFRNEKGAKKADGAILKDGYAIGVIELKSTTTKDLEAIRLQAFDYKANQSKCVYVITSNFEKVRFYIHNAVEFEEFDLFRLTYEHFQLMWLCLAKENLLRGIPLQIKEASILKEEKITKDIYVDYSRFKHDLYNDLVANNLNHEIFAGKEEKDIKLLLFKKSQKLLDRFLFIFFGEDRGLLPANSISKIIEKWEYDTEWGDSKPLYDIFKQYFNFLNIGRPASKSRAEIHAYNGGLFLPDEILDAVKISDKMLNKHTKILTGYDFETEVDVNILGHIFENSLNEIEEVTAQLEGEEIDRKKTKRKKDGVFYTPKYITKYIVENTVGKLCEEKRSELELDENEYLKSRKGRTKKKLQELDKKLDDYRHWLLSLTICDPACGSGAFLNQALDFLIREHRYIDELRAKMLDVPMVFTEVENSILENNIYGVDINEESVEIAKLSLWLRTAQKGRKLTSLSNNIKCGNSLIDDPEVAGEKAFNWQNEFPEVFKNGGFDVVIGNPPYVNANDIKKNFRESEYHFLKNNFETAKGTVDLYIYFFEKGLIILKNAGILAYITPNRFLSASYGKALREFILCNYEIISLIDYSDKKVFIDASTYPVISTFRKRINRNYEVISGKFDENTKELNTREFPSSKLNILQDSILGFLLNDKLKITEKVINQSTPLSSAATINATSTAREADDFSKHINEEEGFRLINTGTIDPYFTTWGINKLTDKGKKYLTPFLPKNTEILKNRLKLYESSKIIIAKIGLKCEAFYDNNGNYASINTNCLHSFNSNFLPEYILCWLNSKLYNYMFECLFDGLRMSGGYLLFSAPNLKNTYIKQLSIEKQQFFIPLSKRMYKSLSSIIELKNNLVELVKSNLDIDNVPNKLLNWEHLEFKNFLKELKKAKVKLTLSEEAEWMHYFNEQKHKARSLKSEIDKTDSEIDQMVYELYGLTEEEIGIVEEK